VNNRLKISVILKSICPNVYFQAPGKESMNYPCIIYERSEVQKVFANNTTYVHTISYMVKVIDKNPDSELNDKMRELPKCGFDRHYVADNLHHDVYTLYY
jgi:trehalose utilization protein